MTITLEPMLALLNLAGGEIILILLVLLIFAIVVAAVIALVLLLRAPKKPSASVPTEPPTQIIRKCPKCGADLKADLPEGLCPVCLLQHGIATEGGAPPGTPSFTPPPLAELAKLFPQLEILEVIGQGGMGAVYKARQPSLDRFVALKILAPRSGGDLDFSGRFSREARALARLSHPNIVGVYDFGQIRRDASAGTTPETASSQPLSYFIMEYVDGPNLRQIEQAGKLTPREALQIIPQICVALQFAHDEGIVHRDIKPENVLLDKKGRVKIADFGLAKILGQEADFRLTGARDVMGTPHYMAPEQVEKPQEVDHRADIYSLGVVFYEMLTGDLPLGKFDPPSHKVQIDVRLDDIVLRSLANNPDRRYQQVSQFKTEIETVATTPSAPAGAPSRAALMAAYAPGWEYKSERTIFGLPLLHVSGGINPATGKPNISRGIFAFGQIAQGLYASGGQAVGVVAFGGMAAGFLAMGGMAGGIIAFGGLALALLAIGGTAVGITGIGGMPLMIHQIHDYHRIGAFIALFLVPLFGALIAHFLVHFWARKRAVVQILPSGQRPSSASAQNETTPLSRAQSVVLTVINIIVAILLLFGGWTAYRLNVFFNTVFFFILLMVPIRFFILLWRGFQDGLEYEIWKKPLAHKFSKHRWQIANRWIFWLLCVAILEICMVPPQFSTVSYAVMRALYLGGAGVLLLLELLPARRLRLATNIAIAIGSLFMVSQIVRIYSPEAKANSVVLSMPVRGEWLILHGGRSSLINSHYFSTELRDALDIEKLVDGHERINVRDKLDSYPSWGQTVYAPADGKVAVAENDIDDHGVGNNDYENLLGNHICLDIGGNRFVMMANLQKGSVLVSTGEVVHAGQPLAKIGNSGSSSHPHLHLQVQDAPRIFVTGQPDAKTFSIRFRDATRLRGKNKFAGAPFFVRRNDWIVSDAKEEVVVPETTNAPATAETWAPTIMPGEKPDLRKILEDADYLMGRGHFEESLGRYIWFFNHANEYGDSYESSLRTTSAMSSWAKLGQSYPKAKQALLEIRDHDINEFTQGRGRLELFQDVQAINRELKNDDATYALFNAIRKGDPQLAGPCYFWVESQLVAKGDYEVCYESIGDGQSRLANAIQMFQMDLQNQKRMVAMREQTARQLAEMYRQRGQTNVPIATLPDSSAMMINQTTNRLVGAAGMLVEILVGTGHTNEAVKIRDQALTVFDDPRLRSVIEDAQQRVQQRRKTALEKPTQTTNSNAANITVASPGKWAMGITNTSGDTAETWTPVLKPDEEPDLSKILQEAKDLMSRHQYEASLQRQIWYYNHSLSNPSQAGVRVSFALADWVELGRRYPKAMRALVEIRNDDQQKLAAGAGSFSLFMELKAINDELGDEQGTYTLFKKLDAQNPELARQYYYAAEGLLISRGEYKLCFRYLGEPEERFKRIQSAWQQSRQFEQRQDDMRRQMEERMRSMQPSATNGIAIPPSMFTPPASPKFADKNFVAQTRQLIEILVGVDDQSDAGKIRDEAVALLDDPRLKSAVGDAEEKVHPAKM